MSTQLLFCLWLNFSVQIVISWRRYFFNQYFFISVTTCQGLGTQWKISQSPLWPHGACWLFAASWAGVSKLQPWDHSSLLPDFGNKVLLEQSHAHLSSTSGFPLTMAEWVVVRLSGLQNFVSSPFQNRFVDPVLKMQIRTVISFSSQVALKFKTYNTQFECRK